MHCGALGWRDPSERVCGGTAFASLWARFASLLLYWCGSPLDDTVVYTATEPLGNRTRRLSFPQEQGFAVASLSDLLSSWWRWFRRRRWELGSSLWDDNDDNGTDGREDFTDLAVGCFVLGALVWLAVHLLLEDTGCSKSEGAVDKPVAPEGESFSGAVPSSGYAGAATDPNHHLASAVMEELSLDSMLDDWSRGLTICLDVQARRLMVEACGHDPCVVRVLCGTMWFRFHVAPERRGSFSVEEALRDCLELRSPSGPLSAVDEPPPPLTCLRLVQHALGPRIEGVVASLFQALTILSECKCPAIPAAVLDPLLEEILRHDESRRTHQATEHNASLTAAGSLPETARQLRNYMVLLNVFRVERGRVRLHTPALKGKTLLETAAGANTPEWPSPFVRRLHHLSQETAAASFWALHLVPLCLSLRHYRGAERLLQHEAVADERIREYGVARAVSTWLDDLDRLRDGWQASSGGCSGATSVADFDAAFGRSCRVMASRVLRHLSVDPAAKFPRDTSLDAARALHRLGRLLLHQSDDPVLGLECLERAQDALLDVLEDGLSDVRERFRSLALAYRSTGDLRRACVCETISRASAGRGGNDQGSAPRDPWPLLRSLIGLGSAFFAGGTATPEEPSRRGPPAGKGKDAAVSAELVVEGLRDDVERIGEACEWLARCLGELGAAPSAGAVRCAALLWCASAACRASVAPHRRRLADASAFLA